MMGGGRLHGASHESGGAMDGVRGRGQMMRGGEEGKGSTEHRTGAAGHGLEEMDTDDTDTTVSADVNGEDGDWAPKSIAREGEVEGSYRGARLRGGGGCKKST